MTASLCASENITDPKPPVTKLLPQTLRSAIASYKELYKSVVLLDNKQDAARPYLFESGII